MSKLSVGKEEVLSIVKAARARGAHVLISAITLTEVLRGGPRDAEVHRVLARITVVPVSPEIARASGELLGRAGLSGHRCAIDAVVAQTALRQERPVLLLTSDPDDMHRLVEEPDRPKHERVAVVHV
ncbi:type II toxin-antitoxin system VapC family toxin [Nocardiopsis protaetiae]|uniref:type II toxin-antitoxin system VapC family toxin n=1 Tax=Nocardiopsis protaetiae TaxID=3382270 RepID=UPI00387AC285